MANTTEPSYAQDMCNYWANKRQGLPVSWPVLPVARVNPDPFKMIKEFSDLFKYTITGDTSNIQRLKDHTCGPVPKPNQHYNGCGGFTTLYAGPTPLGLYEACAEENWNLFHEWWKYYTHGREYCVEPPHTAPEACRSPMWPIVTLWVLAMLLGVMVLLGPGLLNKYHPLPEEKEEEEN